MNTKYVGAKLFFGLAVLSAVLGVFLFRRDLPGEFYLNPYDWLSLPRLVPLAVAFLSACFGVVYFLLERKVNRVMSVPLVVAHLVLFLLAILGHLVHLRFWWRVLGTEHATHAPFPLWSAELEILAFLACCLLFAVNIFRSKSAFPSRA